jgi:hypothetical protein
MKLTFTNKQEYLAYRSNWKAQYKELSQQIRDYKFCRWFVSLKNPARITPELEEQFKKIVAKHGNRAYYVYPLKRKATSMLQELKESKIEAQRQYLATKVSVQV